MARFDPAIIGLCGGRVDERDMPARDAMES
jgi:hypothetical protein